MAEPAAISIRVVGRNAADCLRALADDGGSVLAVFRRSVYLSHDGSGAIACIGPAALGAGPLNALAGAAADAAMPDWQMAGLRPGDPVTTAGPDIRIGGGRLISFAEAGIHDPPPGPCAWTGEGLAAALGILADGLAAFPLADGLAPFAHPERRTAPPTAPVTERARPAICALDRWLERGAATMPPQDAFERLIGLGPGLTPSGDDLLGGMMIALSMSGRADAAAALARPALAVAAHGTNRISAAHLSAAARGFGADALHLSIDALARRDRAALASALRGLDAIGHSSGWDAMAGAVAVLAAGERLLAAQPDSSATAVSAAPALDWATTTPASRRAST